MNTWKLWLVFVLSVDKYFMSCSSNIKKALTFQTCMSQTFEWISIWSVPDISDSRNPAWLMSRRNFPVLARTELSSYWWSEFSPLCHLTEVDQGWIPFHILLPSTQNMYCIGDNKILHKLISDNRPNRSY